MRQGQTAILVAHLSGAGVWLFATTKGFHLSHGLHIPHFQASLLLMTHLRRLITGSSARFPASNCRISLLRTPFHETERPMQKAN